MTSPTSIPATQYHIRVGYPWVPADARDLSMGWCRTLQAAVRRGERMRIRTDCQIIITLDSAVLYASGQHSGPGGYGRRLSPIAEVVR